MTDTKSLVERLRSVCGCNIDTSPCGAEEECRVCFEAADAIAALEQERDEAQADRVKANNEWRLDYNKLATEREVAERRAEAATPALPDPVIAPTS